MNKPAVSFAARTSFNSEDTTAVTRDGRIEVSLGVRKRCELVLSSVLRLTKDSDVGTSVAAVLRDLHSRKYDSYTSRDIKTAMLRLMQGEAVEKVMRGKWAPTENAKKVWKAAISKK